MHAAGKRYIAHGSRSDQFTLWVLGDVHLGAKACDEKRFIADVATISKDPYAFWIGIGDYCDHIGHRDKRFCANEIADWVSVSNLGNFGQVVSARARDLMAPIKNKCLGLLYGNHEGSYMAQNEQSGMHKWLCHELGVADLGYCCLMDVVFRRTSGKSTPRLIRHDNAEDMDVCSKQFRIFAHHGAGSSATPGGKLNRVIKFMQDFEADIYMMGHVHDQKGQRRVRIEANAKCDALVQKESIGVITGSYLKCYPQGHSSYGEQKGYSPTSLGAVKIFIKPETRQVWAEV